MIEQSLPCREARDRQCRSRDEVYGDTARSEMRFPPLKLVLADRKRHVQYALPAMPGNSPARQNDGLRRRALEKDQKDIAPRHGIGRQPVVAVDRLQPKHVLVEGTRAQHILGVDRGFQDAIELRHSSNRLHIARSNLNTVCFAPGTIPRPSALSQTDGKRGDYRRHTFVYKAGTLMIRAERTQMELLLAVTGEGAKIELGSRKWPRPRN